MEEKASGDFIVAEDSSELTCSQGSQNFFFESPRRRQPFSKDEDEEILKIVNSTELPVGGETLWKLEASKNKVNNILFHMNYI